jgi:hypothetical protein
VFRTFFKPRALRLQSDARVSNSPTLIASIGIAMAIPGGGLKIILRQESLRMRHWSNR